MRRSTHEYDTELRHNGEVITFGNLVYRGRTVLDEGPGEFAPLERWARGVAEIMGAPVTWRAAQNGEVVREETVDPPASGQSRLAL